VNITTLKENIRDSDFTEVGRVYRGYAILILISLFEKKNIPLSVLMHSRE
jgi:hypothetical protein